MQFSIRNAEADREAQQKNLWALEARDRELDRLFERIYEDNISGKLTNERLPECPNATMLNKRAGREDQSRQEDPGKSSGKTLTKDMFLSTVRK